MSQPFADLIISRKKTIELRNWNTKFRGEFLIHSPQKVRKLDCKRLGYSQQLVTGAIIGKAEIYDVKNYNSKNEVKNDAKFHFATKDHYDRKYGFLIKNAKALRIPIPYKGKLGFFEVNLPKVKVRKNEIQTDIIDEEYRYQWINHH